VESSSLHNIVQSFQEQLSKTHDLITSRLEPHQVTSALSFVDTFSRHAVPENLTALSTEQLADLLVKNYLYLEQRQASACSNYIDLPDQNCGVLVCACSDAPFLFDSLLLFLKREQIHWSVICHLSLNIERQKHQICQIHDSSQLRANESFMMIQVEAGSCRPDRLAALNDIFVQVMQLDRDCDKLMDRLDQLKPLAEEAGHSHFWEWLIDDNFTPLSYRQLKLIDTDTETRFEAIEEESLGLNDDSQRVLHLKPQSIESCDLETRSCLMRESRMVVDETNTYSSVWRDETYTAIYLRQEVGSGTKRQSIEHIILGLYHPTAQRTSSLKIAPLLNKISCSLARLQIAPGSYDYRKIEELLATFPKTELFFLSEDQLDEIINSLLFYNHATIRVIPLDNELSSLSLLLMIPRDLSPNADFKKLETHLSNHFKADSLTTRVLQFGSDHYIIQININRTRDVQLTDLDALSQTLTSLMQSWHQKLRTVLVREHGTERGLILWRRYHNAFCDDYRARIHPRFCARDILQLEELLATTDEQVEMWGPVAGAKPSCRLQFFSMKQSYLNEMMPILVNLDLIIIDEVDFSLNIDGAELYIKSFGVLNEATEGESLLRIKPRLLESLVALRTGMAENDYLNRLLIKTGLDWQQIDIFRGYRNYYFQLGSPFTKRTVAFALINNPRSVIALYRYFEARFLPNEEWIDPTVREEQALFPARLELIDALQEVENVNEDRILRTIFNLIDSTVRTNFFKRINSDDYFFSFKISAIGINEMPVPRPLYEVYVHNATMEGIHLRGGMVARGGIRWSDRPDDFRTEVLGLMKTQMTKNALIVPVGSKGGFVIKQSYKEREEGLALSKRAYQTLMRGLLDLTDNRIAGEVIPAQDVIRYDEDDPYLVVAADKGTAHLPDTANGISAEYGFWLDDGFASGGSRGYDHKVLGITARGAWVCVQRHFREMGIDIQREPFSVVGIGDMSGDVFGNGMLLSEQICLKAAFNHLHIFLDPNPDPAKTFPERQRLFNLPRSSWADFDTSLISPGGGVFDRHAKEIPLSTEIKDWLGVRYDTLDGDSLIQLLLKAEVDLLWNGGIGTYVKSSSEKNEDAGDRANDALRINGNQVRAKVIGEGGNLGMTQLARIEYALSGGRINTDAVDNSAGVDCSDHEVNLKIFMQHLMESGDVADGEQRDQLLGAVTEDVCDAVLVNNYEQSMCLSLDVLRNDQDRELFADLSSRLVAIGLLNRQSEALPTTKEVNSRKHGYVRPELAILMAYSKMQLYQALLDDSDLGSNGSSSMLYRYFPKPIQQQFNQQLADHPLRREIIATMITNNVVDRAGSTFCFRMARRYDVSLPKAAEAHAHFSHVIGADLLRQEICAGDNHIASDIQYQLLLDIERCVGNMCDWALSHNQQLLEHSFIEPLQQNLDSLLKLLSSVLSEKRWQRCQERSSELLGYGLSEEVAFRLSTLTELDNLLPLVSLLQGADYELHPVALTLNEVQTTFDIDSLLALVQQVPQRDRWDRMTKHLLTTRFNYTLFSIVQKVLQDFDGNLDALLAAERKGYRRYKRLSEQIHDQTTATFHPYMVVIEQLQTLC